MHSAEEKLLAFQEEIHILLEFLAWIEEHERYALAEKWATTGKLSYFPGHPEKLVYEYFGIDYEKYMREKHRERYRSRGADTD